MWLAAANFGAVSAAAPRLLSSMRSHVLRKPCCVRANAIVRVFFRCPHQRLEWWQVDNITTLEMNGVNDVDGIARRERRIAAANERHHCIGGGSAMSCNVIKPRDPIHMTGSALLAMNSLPRVDLLRQSQRAELIVAGGQMAAATGNESDSSSRDDETNDTCYLHRKPLSL
jgi:hypothetical protein